MSFDKYEDIDVSQYKIKSFSGMCVCGGKYITDDGLLQCIECGDTPDIKLDEYMMNMEKPDEGFTVEQRKIILRKLTIYNKNAEMNKTRAFPDNVLEAAVENFAKLRECTKETRSDKMIARLGACLYNACIHYNLMRSRKEIKRFLCLSKSITSSVDMIKIKENIGVLKTYADENIDVRISFANNLCIRADVTDINTRNIICNEVVRILNICNENVISVSAMHESKVAACTYISMKLCDIDISVDDMSSYTSIHSDTLLKIIDDIRANNKLFNFKKITI